MGDAVSVLMGLPRFTDQGGSAYKPGFERIEALLEAMGRPHERFDSIHVAGTNGKGSTSSMIAAVATSAGLKTGLHTSPHLFRLHERMRIDGVPVPDAWLNAAVERYRDLLDRVRPSFFEALVAFSFLYFADESVDVAVIEVGMGGRLDATNVLTPRVSVITSISLDHTEFLGNTLSDIAREKAGIIKPGVPVVYGDDPVSPVFRRVAAEKGAPSYDCRVETHVLEVKPAPDGLVLSLETPLRTYSQLQIDLHGRHQVQNARLAIRASELAFKSIQDDAHPVQHGLSNVRRLSGLRGRLEVLRSEKFAVMDVGHNPEGLRAALDFMALRGYGRDRLKVIFGVMHDKDVDRMAELLAGGASGVFVVRLEGDRAMPALQLAQKLQQAGVSVAGTGSVLEGMTWFDRHGSEEDALLITGSHLVASQVPPSILNFPVTP